MARSFFLGSSPLGKGIRWPALTAPAGFHATSRAVDADPYDAILVVGFGGPERVEDVLPFLENVTRGRNIPRDRLLEVAEHYHHFGGVSPINAQVRALIAALRPELDQHGISLPIYWGNRNWHPLLADTLTEMTGAGIKRALAVVLAAYSSYSSCRQYREDIERARADGRTRCTPSRQASRLLQPPRVHIRQRRQGSAGARVVRRRPSRLRIRRLHSTQHSGLDGEELRLRIQLRETCRLVADEVGIAPDCWALVYQSRSGRPGDPWLEPDILDHLKDLQRRGVKDVVIHPIGFLSDHMEVMYDLDEEARHLCDAIGLTMVRSQTVGTHPRFVEYAPRADRRADRVAWRDQPPRGRRVWAQP